MDLVPDKLTTTLPKRAGNTVFLQYYSFGCEGYWYRLSQAISFGSSCFLEDGKFLLPCWIRLN